MFCTVFLGGCSEKVKVELAPKHTRAIHPVDAKNADILSQENYNKITDGMTQDEVRAIFGTTMPVVKNFKPDESYELVWQYGEKEIAVKFRGEHSDGKSQKGILREDNPQKK
jgi:outer membrane protein assembly factor BamE (lipoprotein component of BamABCDE complex)